MSARTTIKTTAHAVVASAASRIGRSPRLGYGAFAMVAFHDRFSETVSDEARFIAFCSSMRHLAHGQILQDLWVLFELDLRHDGYFVEFGAHDGRVHSNSLLLEETFGWSGLLAEPNPDMVEVLRRTRRAEVDPRCVWETSGGEVELTITDDPELSTVVDRAETDLHTAARRRTAVRTVAVPTVSLDDLLDEHDVPASFDFLSVDTEGTELLIMRAFDPTRHRPRLVAVEHNGRADVQTELDALMASHGYERRFAHLSDWDAWYRSTRP